MNLNYKFNIISRFSNMGITPGNSYTLNTLKKSFNTNYAFACIVILFY